LSFLIDLITEPAAWAALAALVAMEIALGVDNLVFVALLSNRVAAGRRAAVRRIGLSLALVFRLALLGAVAFVTRLTSPLVALFGHSFSARDLILLAGGLFLVWKATREIHEHVEPAAGEGEDAKRPLLGVVAAIVQIVMLDLVFSIDSIITAVGMTDIFAIMAAAVIVAVLLMMAASGPLAAFIARNPTIVMLALSFLLMIGMTLIADGFGFHVERGYIYAAMGFSTLVEALNTLARRRRHGAPGG
jgi:predicted tellurium resistance membrane protein TerC